MGICSHVFSTHSPLLVKLQSEFPYELDGQNRLKNLLEEVELEENFLFCFMSGSFPLSRKDKAGAGVAFSLMQDTSICSTEAPL